VVQLALFVAKIVAGRVFDSLLAKILFFFLQFFKTHLLRPLCLNRDWIRPDLARYTLEFNDFYILLIGFERQGEITY